MNSEFNGGELDPLKHVEATYSDNSENNSQKMSQEIFDETEGADKSDEDVSDVESLYDDKCGNNVSEKEATSTISEKIKYGHYKMCEAKKNGKASKSTVWEIFRFIVDERGKILSKKIACKQCLKVWTHTRKSGYKHLHSHITNCPKNPSKDLTEAQKKTLKTEFKNDLVQFVCQDLQSISAIQGGGLKHLANRLI